MQLSEVLSLDCTKSAVQCTSKKRALELISQIAAESCGQDSTELFECMLSREKMGSTGIGNGIAIPHARMNVSDKAIAVLLQCQDRSNLMRLITVLSTYYLLYLFLANNVKSI